MAAVAKFQDVSNKHATWQVPPSLFEELRFGPYLNLSDPIQQPFSWSSVATSAGSGISACNSRRSMGLLSEGHPAQLRRPGEESILCAAEYVFGGRASEPMEDWMVGECSQRQLARGFSAVKLSPPKNFGGKFVEGERLSSDSPSLWKRRRVTAPSPQTSGSSSPHYESHCRDQELSCCTGRPSWQREPLFRSPMRISSLSSSSPSFQSDDSYKQPKPSKTKKGLSPKAAERRTDETAEPHQSLQTRLYSAFPPLGLHQKQLGGQLPFDQRQQDHMSSREGSPKPESLPTATSPFSTSKEVLRWTRSVGAKLARRLTGESKTEQKLVKRSSFASLIDTTGQEPTLQLQRRKSFVGFDVEETTESRTSSFYSAFLTDHSYHSSDVSLDSFSSTAEVSSMELAHRREHLQAPWLARHSATQAITGATQHDGQTSMTGQARSVGQSTPVEEGFPSGHADSPPDLSQQPLSKRVSISKALDHRNSANRRPSPATSTIRRVPRNSFGTYPQSLSTSHRPSGTVEVVYRSCPSMSQTPVDSPRQETCHSNEAEESLLDPMGLKVPVAVLIQMAQSAHVALKSDLISKHPVPLFYVGVPYLAHRTYNWIRLVTLLILLSLTVEAVKVVVVMEKMTSAIAFASMPLAVVSHLSAYLALRLASYWMLVAFTLSAAFIGMFDVVLTVTFATGIQEAGLESDLVSKGFYLSITLLSAIGLIAAIAVVARACVLVRKDVSDLAVQIPIEWLEETLDPQPFLLWYFGLPSVMSDWVSDGADSTRRNTLSLFSQ